MIRFTTENGEIVCVAELKNRFGVYLDSDSLFELAEGTALRRQRFVDALRHGGTLLFSFTNAVEFAGPQGESAIAVRAFLESVGPYWIPLEMDPIAVVERERIGLIDQAPVSERFMEAYCKERVYELSQKGSKMLDPSANTFFHLSAVFDWVQEDRTSIRDNALQVSHALQEWLKQLRADYEKDPTSLNRWLPPDPFDDRWPATFVLRHLLRMLVIKEKAFQFNNNNTLDFCHAVLAAAYGSVVTLDKKWKSRVENLPGPNRLAKVYYRPEVNQLVDVLESLVTSKQTLNEGHQTNHLLNPTV